MFVAPEAIPYFKTVDKQNLYDQNRPEKIHDKHIPNIKKKKKENARKSIFITQKYDVQIFPTVDHI